MRRPPLPISIPLGKPPEVEITEATPEDFPLIKRLYQLHRYDLSEVLKLDTDANGEYIGVNEAWVDETESPQAYILRSEGLPIGYVLFTRNQIGPGRWENTMSEMFVMRRHRRRGIGRQVAYQFFESYRGDWSVLISPANKVSIFFWRNVVGSFSRGLFHEETPSETEPRIRFRFLSVAGS